MKKIVRIVALVLAVVLVASAMAPAVSAATLPTYGTQSSNYISFHDERIRIDGTTITVSYDIYATSVLDQLGARVVILQYSKDGSTWINLHTYNYTNPAYRDQMLGESTSFFSGSVSYTGVVSGFYYRAYVTIYGGDGGSNGDGAATYTDIIRG